MDKIINEPLVYFKNGSKFHSVWNGTDTNVGFADADTKNNAIIFVEDEHKIYTHGQAFGGSTSIGGDEITINNGIISENNLPIASKSNKGIVQIGDGIAVTTAGLISANIPEIINGINGQAGKDGVPGLNAGEPAQYLKNATYSNNVLTITPNSGSSISVAIPTSGNGNTGGSTYYGGTGISIDDLNLISVKQATNSERGGVKIWTKDNNVTINGITLGDSNNRRYAVNLDSNGVAYVQVPWSDTTFDPVNNEYIQTKLDLAEQRQNELSGQMEDIADNLATIVDEEFQQKLTQAREAIENAQDDLDRLQELLLSDVVLRTDPTQVKLAEFLDRGNNSYYTFDEAIDLTLAEKLSDTNPEATVYSKVLKIVKDNSIDGETVNGRISSAVTNVKDEITTDLDGYAKKQFVAETVSTLVNAAKQEVYDTYTDGGLTISSDGKVKIDASKAKFTNGNVQEQSLSEIINDAKDGIMAVAATKDWVTSELKNSGLILGTDGSFSLLSQLRKLANGSEEEVGELESLAGIIGDTDSVGGKISALAESAITGAKASIIAEARGDQSWIELTADQITLAGETIADKINALEITTGNLNTTNANIQSRLSTAEAKIGTLEVGTVDADYIKSVISTSEMLNIGDDEDSMQISKYGIFFAQDLDELNNSQQPVRNVFGEYSHIGKSHLTFYEGGTKNKYGLIIGGNDASRIAMTSEQGASTYIPCHIELSDLVNSSSADIGENNTNIYPFVGSNYASLSVKQGNNITSPTELFLRTKDDSESKYYLTQISTDVSYIHGDLKITNGYSSNTTGTYRNNSYLQNMDTWGTIESGNITSHGNIEAASLGVNGALKLHNPSNVSKKVEIKYRPITNLDNTLTDYLYVDAWGLIIGSNDSSRIESTDSGTDFYSDHELFYFNAPIQVNGAVTNTSDRNLKNIVSDITLTAQQVADAPAVNFTWKNDENNINHVGSIAQYWQVVMPEVVKEDKNGNLGLDYSTTALMSSITVAKKVMELEEKIAQLEAKINELTSNN